MSSSRVSRLMTMIQFIVASRALGVCLGAVALVVAWSGPVWSADTDGGAEPVPAPSSALTPPPALAPPPEASSPTLQAIGPRPGVDEPTVEVGTLGAPETAGVGVMTARQGGLPRTMWRGTSYTTAVDLLGQGPVPSYSRAGRDLTRRFLLTESDPPVGAEGRQDLLALRLSRLLDAGDLESVLRLSRMVIPSGEASRELSVRADALLLKGDTAGACDLGRDMRRRASDAYWAKLGAYCDVEAGDTPAAELAVALMRDRQVDAPAFYALYDWLVVPPKKKDAVPPTGDGSALALVMMRKAGLMASDPAAFAGRPAYLRAYALEASGGSAQSRLAAATEAARFGAFPLDSLRALYTLEAFAPEAVADPAAAAGGFAPPLALALLYQSVATAPTADQRLARSLVAYRYAAPMGYGDVMVGLLAPSLQGVQPAPGLVFAAPVLTEAMLVARDAAQAYLWYGLIDPRAENPGQDPRQRDHLANALRLAQPSERLTWTPEDVQRLLERASLYGPDAKAATSFEVRLLMALGYAVPPEAAAALSAPAPLSGPLAERIAAFEAAVADTRLAEATLHALLALGAEGSAKMPEAAVVSLVAGLNRLGLTSDARAIAVEAVLGRP